MKSLALITRTIVLDVLTVMLLFIADVSAEQPTTSEGNLIYSSIGAQQVASGTSEKAKTLHQEAKDLYQQALTAPEAGETERLLNSALEKMVQAIRASVPKALSDTKPRNDFDAMEESLQSLLIAHGRITTEKGRSADHQQLNRQVKVLMGRAHRLYMQEKFGQARGILDGAYQLVRAFIESIRGGDTLVRSLNFASKKEEYEYELDRNNTHQMLITLLLEKQQKQSEDLHVKVEAYKLRAVEYREGADNYAAQGNYEAALEGIEKSTKELIKAIRSGGIYIPG